MTDQLKPTEITAQWLIDAGNVPLVVNQILVQPGVPIGADGPQDGFYVTLGHLSPPVITGTTQEEKDAFLQGQIFPVVPVGRFFASRKRLEQFRDQIDKVLTETVGAVE